MNRGVDIVTVKELLGHSTVTVTMRYAHNNMDGKRDAVGKSIAGLLQFRHNKPEECSEVENYSRESIILTST